MVVSTSMCETSMISSTFASTPRRSPLWAKRAETWPAKGAFKIESSKALLATSAPACAARKVACAVCRFDREDSKAVLEMNPWSTNALLFSYCLWAISIWALAASAVSWACLSGWSDAIRRPTKWFFELTPIAALLTNSNKKAPRITWLEQSPLIHAVWLSGAPT